MISTRDPNNQSVVKIILTNVIIVEKENKGENEKENFALDDKDVFSYDDKALLVFLLTLSST